MASQKKGSLWLAIAYRTMVPLFLLRKAAFSKRSANHLQALGRAVMKFDGLFHLG